MVAFHDHKFELLRRMREFCESCKKGEVVTKVLCGSPQCFSREESRHSKSRSEITSWLESPTPRRMLCDWGSGLVRKAPNKDLSGMALVLFRDGRSAEKH